MPKIICNRCNTLVEVGRFCSNCATSMVVPQQARQAPQPHNANQPAHLTTKKRTWHIWLIIIGIIVGLSILRNASNRPSEVTQPTSSTSIPQTPTQPIAPAAWHEVAKFAGKSIKQTETFTIPGDEWRIGWDTKAGTYGAMNFQIYVYKPDRSLANVAANVIGADKDSTIMRGSGAYYLQINTAQPYSIVVDAKY